MAENSPRVIRVFVASPGDVHDARDTVKEVVDGLNTTWGRRSGLSLQMLDWRTHVTPWLGKPPEKIVLQQLPVDTWDLLVAIFWSRMGTPTGNFNSMTGEPFKSGTEEEFTLAFHSNQARNTPRILLYRCMADVPVTTDLDQLKLVRDFFTQFSDSGRYFGLYQPYQNIKEFGTLVHNHLTDALFDYQEGVKPVEKSPSFISGLQQWLKYVRLSSNPFTDWNAGMDENLPKYFHVAVPYFDQLMGNLPDLPPSIVVLGERGLGKSALCQMISFYSNQKPGQRNVLAVMYTDFSVLAEKLLTDGSISPRDHVEQILTVAIQTLAVNARDGSAKIRSSASVEDRQEFIEYVNAYGQSLGQAQRTFLEGLLGLNMVAKEAQHLPGSFTDLFHNFRQVVTRVFEYDILYILVDQVDESHLLDTDEKVVKLLAPLMTEMNLIEPKDKRATFRFFLPSHLRRPLKDIHIRLDDRFIVYELGWSEEDMRLLIERRLRFVSENKDRPYTRLAELSDGIDDLDSQLIAVAQSNPRNLIKLCHYVIEEHCRLPMSADHIQISKESLNKALTRYAGERQSTHSQIPAEGPPNKPLFDSNPLEQKSATSSYQPVDALPTPIAVLAAQYYEEQNPTDKLWQAFGVTQTVLQFTACCLLALYSQYGKKDVNLHERLQSLLFSAEHPPSLGDWRQVTDRIIKQDDLGEITLFQQIKAFRTAKDVGRCITGLIEVRNSMAHGRSTPETQQLYQVNEYLGQLLAGLEPVSLCHLGSIERHTVDDHDDIIHIIRLHRGNLVVPRKLQLRLNKNHKADLAILFEPQSGMSLNLWPFLTYRLPSETGVDDIRSEICLYDQLTDPQKKNQFAAQYVNPITKQTYLSTSLLTDFKSLGFLS
jgi:hypothetical protein